MTQSILSHDHLTALCRELIEQLKADIVVLRAVRDELAAEQDGVATELSYHVGGITATINRAERELQ